MNRPSFPYNENGCQLGRYPALLYQAVVWSSNMSFTYAIKKDFKVESRGFFRSPTQTLQGSNLSFRYFSFGANKDFNKRFTVGLSVVQPWSQFLRFETELESENFYQLNWRDIQFRSFRLNLAYKFGKLNFKQPRQRRSKIRNNDQKGGGNEGGGEFGG